MVRVLLVSLTIAAAAAAGSVAFEASARAVASPHVSATARDSLPTNRADATAAMDASLAAAVIGSVSAQFRAPDVRVQIVSLRVTPTSVQDRQVVGTGRVQLAAGSPWMGFSFAALYDTRSTEVTYPVLKFDGGVRTVVARSSSIARSFNTQVSQALSAEFADQNVGWTLRRATSSGAGRFVRIEAEGEADFGRDGRTSATVQGVLDTRTGRWARVHYELGAGSEWAAGSSAVASL